jgi:hypothetical protein
MLHIAHLLLFLIGEKLLLDKLILTFKLFIMKKIVFFTLMTSLFVNAQLTPANLAFYKYAYPVIAGNSPTNNLNLYDSQSGTAISGSDNIKIDSSVIAPSGTSFTFEVTDFISGDSRTITSSSSIFKLSDLPNPSGFVRTNRTYVVRARMNNGDIAYRNFGNNCVIMTKPLVIYNSGTTNLVPQGGLINLTNYQLKALNSSPFGLGVRFRITRGDGVVFNVNSPTYTLLFTNNVNLNPNIPSNYFTTGSRYCVDVAIINPDNSIGAYTDNVSACFTYGSATARTSIVEDIKTSFEAIISPNPSNDNFNLDVTTSSKSPIEVSVIDINGRIIEIKKYTSHELSNLQIGNNYHPGVYNMTVSQDENKKTLKLIKE